MKGDCKFIEVLRYHYDTHVVAIDSVELLIKLFKIDYEYATNHGKTPNEVVEEWFSERE